MDNPSDLSLGNEKIGKLDRDEKPINVKKPYTSKDKWIVSILSGLLFFLLASPFMFDLTNGLTKLFGLRTVNIETRIPTIFGLTLHAFVYMVIVKLLMR